MLKSSHIRAHQNLGVISPARAKAILRFLANVPDWSVGDEHSKKWHTAWIDAMRKAYPGTYGFCSTIDMIALRKLLRLAWSSPDSQTREWLVFLLRHLHAGIVRRAQFFQDNGADAVRDWQDRKKAQLNFLLENPDKAVQALHDWIDTEEAYAVMMVPGPPNVSQFELAALYLSRNLRHARYCPGPKCKKPYFFISKKGQKYCCRKCANPSRRESKLRWWNENRAKPKSTKGAKWK